MPFKPLTARRPPMWDTQLPPSPSPSSQDAPPSSPAFTPLSHMFPSQSQSQNGSLPAPSQYRRGGLQVSQSTASHLSSLSILSSATLGEQAPSNGGVAGAVGYLVGEVDGEIVRAVITVDRVLLIGRDRRCDIRIDRPHVSGVHLCITPVRTNTTFTSATVINYSDLPFELNGVAMHPKVDAKLGTRRHRTVAYILKEHDQISFTQCPELVFTFYQGNAHQPPDAEFTESMDDWEPMFETASPFAVHRLPHWTIVNIPLGTGSYGAVHLASHKQAAWLQVACKTLKSKPDTVAKSLTEVQVLLGLAHSNVNAILDIVEEGPSPRAPTGRIHLILELMAGGDLFAYSEKHMKLPETEVKWIAYQLVEGLKYIHQKKVAHRDIKPENILLAASTVYPRVVIGDFGHAMTYEEVYDQTPESDADSGSRTFPVIGTMSFIPPERLKIWSRPRATLRGMVEDVPRKRVNGKLLTRRETIADSWFTDETKLDSWALGVVLFIIATGTHPYESGPIQVPDTLAMASNRRLSSSQSWASYRYSVGETHRLGTAVLGAPGAAARDMYEKCRGPTDWWFSAASWRGWSSEGRSIMRKLFAPPPAKRLAMDDAGDHPWFKNDAALLEELYTQVVSKGEVLNPTTAAQIVEKVVSQPTDAPESRPSNDPSDFHDPRKHRERLFLPSQATCSTQPGTLPSVAEVDEDSDVEMS